MVDDIERIKKRYQRRALARRMQRLYRELECSLTGNEELLEQALRRAEETSQSLSGTRISPDALQGRH
jgi:hypothetical protein